MLSLRRTLFGLVGGFAITDMYIDCTCLADIRFDPSPPPVREHTGHNLVDRIIGLIAEPLSGLLPPPPPPPLPPTSLREDLALALQQNRVVGTLLGLMVVSSGGVWSLIGSSAAIAFNGADGVERYSALREWLRR